MTKPSMNLQDAFLNQVRKDGAEVRVVMVDGSTLTGSVRGFDNFTVIIQCGMAQHLLYKHAIAQLVSARPPRREAPPERREAAPRPEPERPAGDGTADGKGKAAAFNAMDLSRVRGSENPAS